MNDILAIFTKEDKNDLKVAFKEIICNQFKNELEELSDNDYLFDTDEMNELIRDAFVEIIDDLKDTYREQMKKVMDKKFKEFVKNI